MAPFGVFLAFYGCKYFDLQLYETMCLFAFTAVNSWYIRL